MITPSDKDEGSQGNTPQRKELKDYIQLLAMLRQDRQQRDSEDARRDDLVEGRN